MKTLGQEFHPHEAIRALRSAEKIKAEDRNELTLRIAADLPQAGEGTRRGIAAKFIQRYLKASRAKIAPWNTQDFARLVAKVRHAPTQIELLYFELTRTEELVGVMARELFYPVCVQGIAPVGYTEVEFAARNGSRLLHSLPAGASPLVTREFIAHHAREAWHFDSASSLDRALRVLLGAGLIARERMTELRDHPVAFRLAEHDVSPLTFAWALYAEHRDRSDAGDVLVARDEIHAAGFVRTLLLSAAQVERGIEALRRYQLLAAHGELLRLMMPNRSSLVEALLAKAM